MGCALFRSVVSWISVGPVPHPSSRELITMDRIINAHQTAGHAAAARLMPAIPAISAAARHGLGYGWQTVTIPCERSISNGFAIDMAGTPDKRPPRRLGQRTT
jgi:hypothetical protein